MAILNCIRKFSSVKPNLMQHFVSRIKTTGPITVHDYMKNALTHPHLGYYMSRDVFGKEGDFVTSPEISQIFCELLGVWMINEWNNMGKPNEFQIVEFGPGRGTLAADILRISKGFPDFRSSLSLHLIELSPALRFIQSEVLQGKKLPKSLPPNLPENSGTPQSLISPQDGVPIVWHNFLKTVPRIPSCYVAHEFFDALPIHKFQKQDGKWREVLVDIDPSLDPRKEPRLRYVLSKYKTVACETYLSLMNSSDLEKRDHLEICPDSLSLIEQLGERVSKENSRILIADYGRHSNKTDTFRGFRSHKIFDPLLDPGTVDLTADVDFSMLITLLNSKFSNLSVHGPISQASFLSNMGIVFRLMALLRNCKTESDKKYLKESCEKLMSSSEMGERFQFMSVLPDTPNGYLPAGFTPLTIPDASS